MIGQCRRGQGARMAWYRRQKCGGDVIGLGDGITPPWPRQHAGTQMDIAWCLSVTLLQYEYVRKVCLVRLKCFGVQQAAERGLDAGCWDVGSVWQLEFKLSLNLILCLICELQIKTTFATASDGFAGLSD